MPVLGPVAMELGWTGPGGCHAKRSKRLECLVAGGVSGSHYGQLGPRKFVVFRVMVDTPVSPDRLRGFA